MDHPQSNQNNIKDSSPILSPRNDKSMQARSPLSNRANIPIDATANWEHKDSSEGQPSTHDSICDATWLSTSDLAKSPYQTPGRPSTPVRLSIDIDLDSESPLSRLETPFLYGYGTELAPILEQRSIGTLRTKGSLSTSDLSSLLHDAPGRENRRQTRCKSDDTAAHSSKLNLQQPPSHDDTAPDTHMKYNTTEPSPQLKCLTYSRPTVHIVDVHAYPRKPIYPPPQKPTTPPNLTRIPNPQADGDAYIENTFGTVAYEAPNFRPPRSGHGNLTSHPFCWQPRRPRPLSSTAGLRSRESASVPHMGHVAQRSHRGSLGSPDTECAAPPDAGDQACKKCSHPRSEWWSLGAAFAGFRSGARRGSDWCSRCAWKKIVRMWCCGE
ncbi:hypothetical protein GGR50DRAFT_541891 [Xylaria sp. CBS 124048]|nr:hypothetical protein GGR50DRAFT_541891 [Xylaria sp. CBS 124048]